jgi:hypothetical protein
LFLPMAIKPSEINWKQSSHSMSTDNDISKLSVETCHHIGNVVPRPH